MAVVPAAEHVFARRAILARDWLASAALGAVQGVTEFLPVSSSGHLALLERLLGFPRPGLILEVALHAGTLLAVLWAYRGEFRALGSGRTAPRLLLWLAVGSVPAAVAGLLIRGWVDQVFGSLPAIAAAWCLTGGALLLAARRPPGRRRLEALRLSDACWIGVCQAVALFPGVSRSGATIVCGLWRGLAPEEAARFSFLLSVPAVAGAAVLQIAGAAAGGAAPGVGPGLAVGVAVAAVTGAWAIGAFVRRLRAGAFAPYGYYCLALGGLCLLRSAVTGEWR